MTTQVDGEKSTSTRCTRCGVECYDFRQVERDEQVCILCVQTEFLGRIAELERTKRAMATNEGRLHARLAQEQKTLRAIEFACALHGYNPESGVPVGDWIAARFVSLGALPAKWRSRYVDRHFSGAVVECADELERALGVEP